MEQCKYFKDYKGIHPPRCGCDACNRKYQEEERQRRQNEDDAIMAATICAAVAMM